MFGLVDSSHTKWHLALYNRIGDLQWVSFFSEEFQVRFSLQDVRKSVQRRGGNLNVSLSFLRSGELSDEITRLVDYYECLLDQPQRAFSLDEARACIGEYRMAHCLIATLSRWYSWKQREWREVVVRMNGNEDLLTLSSSVQLRLALYSYVNEHHHGFLASQQREEALRTCAERYGVAVADIEYLLALDSEDEAYLVRLTTEPPRAQEVITLYNQWAFEAALFNASSVRFVIDCLAFSRAESDYERAQVPLAGVGAVIKRLCYLARLLGVYYDLAYEQEPARASMLQVAPTLLTLTLYGPQEVTGAPQQYGLRLARLCRLLLGYGTVRTGKKSQLSAGIVEADAQVHFLQREYTFAMDAKLLQLLPAGNEQLPEATEATSDASQLFDSGIEQHFSEAFVSLSRNQGVDGWLLEREPEPLLLDKGIFIPDFALTRSPRRIYVEILGFWTPAYRERKVQKLQYLKGRDDLVLAIPVEAREAFASIATDFPIVYYHGQLSVTDVLRMLRQHYDDFDVRLALIDREQVQHQVRQQGFVVERDCYTLLSSYRRSELQRAAELICSDAAGDLVFTAGLGLYAMSWFTRVKTSFLRWLRSSDVARAPWNEVVSALREQYPILSQCEEATIETLVGLWSEIRIKRDSIFDMTVELLSTISVESSLVESMAPVTSEPDSAPKKPGRERRLPAKKRVNTPPEAVQGDLWGN